jgi:hypothetical protein
MAQKERELISERTKAALAAARARGRVLGGDRGYRPATGPDSQAAAVSRRVAAEGAAHRLLIEVEALRSSGITSMRGLADALTEREVPTPGGSMVWTHTTVARLLCRLGAAIGDSPIGEPATVWWRSLRVRGFAIGDSLSGSKIDGVGVFAVRDIPMGKNPFRTLPKYGDISYVRITQAELDARLASCDRLHDAAKSGRTRRLGVYWLGSILVTPSPPKFFNSGPA